MEELLKEYEKRLEFLRAQVNDMTLVSDIRLICQAQAECLEDVILEINAALEEK